MKGASIFAADAALVAGSVKFKNGSQAPMFQFPTHNLISPNIFFGAPRLAGAEAATAAASARGVGGCVRVRESPARCRFQRASEARTHQTEPSRGTSNAHSPRAAHAAEPASPLTTSCTVGGPRETSARPRF